MKVIDYMWYTSGVEAELDHPDVTFHRRNVLTRSFTWLWLVASDAVSD